MPAYYDSQEMRRRHGIPADAIVACYLEKIDAQFNIAKFWSYYVIPAVTASQWIVISRWGRIDTGGQELARGPYSREVATLDAHRRIEGKLRKGYASPSPRGSSTAVQLPRSRYGYAIDEEIHEEIHEAGNETVHCQCGQPNCRPGPKKQRRKSKTKQRSVQADRFILLEDDDDA